MDRILSDNEILRNGYLQKWQVSLLLSKIKTKICVASRQVGKTTTLKAIILKEALETPNVSILLLSSTLKQSKSIHFKTLFTNHDAIFDKHLIKSLNRTDLNVTLMNGSQITCASCENIDALRGRTADIVIIDEAGHVALEEVMSVIQPVVSARNGTIIMIGTPSGKAHPFYEYVQKGILHSSSFTKGFRTWILPITDPEVVVPNKELRIQQAQSILSKAQYAQEYLCSFDSQEGLVYKEYDSLLNQSYKQLTTIDKTTNKNKALFIRIGFKRS